MRSTVKRYDLSTCTLPPTSPFPLPPLPPPHPGPAPGPSPAPHPHPHPHQRSPSCYVPIHVLGSVRFVTILCLPTCRQLLLSPQVRWHRNRFLVVVVVAAVVVVVAGPEGRPGISDATVFDVCVRISYVCVRIGFVDWKAKRKLLLSYCFMSSGVGWHIRDKLRPMCEHGLMLLYVHGNQKAR